MAPCLSPLCLPVQRRRQTRFHGGHLPISIPKHQFKADDQDAEDHVCKRNRCRAVQRGTGKDLSLAQTFLSPWQRRVEWLISSPTKGLSCPFHWGHCLWSENWKDANMYLFILTVIKPTAGSFHWSVSWLLQALPVYLWSWALGNDQKNKIVATWDQNLSSLCSLSGIFHEYRKTKNRASWKEPGSGSRMWLGYLLDSSLIKFYGHVPPRGCPAEDLGHTRGSTVWDCPTILLEGLNKVTGGPLFLSYHDQPCGWMGGLANGWMDGWMFLWLELVPCKILVYYCVVLESLYTNTAFMDGHRLWDTKATMRQYWSQIKVTYRGNTFDFMIMVWIVRTWSHLVSFCNLSILSI